MTRPVKLVTPKASLPAIDDTNALSTAVTGGLQRVRDAAKNWQTGLAGLLTLVTATLLFKGQDSITDYTPGVQYLLGGLVVLGLVVGVWSLWLLLQAAYGVPKVVRYETIADAGGVDAYNLTLAERAIGNLRLGRITALVSAGLVAAALVFSWYGATSAGSLVKVTQAPLTGGQPDKTRASVLCGSLKTDDSQGVVVQVAGQRDPTTVERANLVSVVPVSGC